MRARASRLASDAPGAKCLDEVRGYEVHGVVIARSEATKQSIRRWIASPAFAGVAMTNENRWLRPKETMMRFVRGIWKLLVGIKDALVLVFMLLFFGCSTSAFRCSRGRSGRGPAGRSRRHRRRTTLKARRAELLAGQGDRLSEYRLRDLVAALDAATTTTGSRRLPWTSMASLAAANRRCRELGAAVRRVRTSGKPVTLMPPVFPTTAISSPPMRPKSGSIHWARWSSPDRAGRTSITRACSTNWE